MTERREPVIQYMGPSMNRCMREILAFRIAQKKVYTPHTQYIPHTAKGPALSNEHLSLRCVNQILYRVISDTCHSMYGYGLGTPSLTAHTPPTRPTWPLTTLYVFLSVCAV